MPAEKQAVTCDPDVIEHTITDQDEFFVLACDGIWDCMTNQQVVNYICKQLADKTKLDIICEELMDNCLAPTSEGGGVGCDNMSVIIVGILNGKTEDEWYDWMAQRCGAPKKDALGNDVVNDTSDNDEEQEIEDVAAESQSDTPVVKDAPAKAPEDANKSTEEKINETVVEAVKEAAKESSQSKEQTT